jgi:MFS transporter, ACS family, D-galactonate transporter
MPATTDRPTLSRPLRIALFLLSLSVFLNYVDRGNLSIAAPLLKDELGLSPSQLGILLSSFFWSYTALQVPAGLLVDRLDVGWILAAGFLIWSAATAATGFMHTFASLLALRLLLGVGEAVAYPSYSKILARDYSHGYLGLANGAIGAGQTSGPAVGTFVGGIFMARFGWRPFFIGLGLLSLIWLLPWLRWRPRHPSPRPAHARAPAPPLAEVLRHRSCWGACLGHFFCNYLIYFLLTWLPFYLVRERNFSMVAMARIGSLAFLLCALSSLVSGPLTDRSVASGSSPTRVRKRMLVVGLVGSGLLLVLCVIATPALSVGLLFGASAFFGLTVPHIFAVAQTLAGSGVAGKWVGFQNFCGNIAGVVAPALTGFLVDRTGHFFWAFAVNGLVAFLGALSWLYVVGPVEPIRWSAAPGQSPARA